MSAPRPKQARGSGTLMAPIDTTTSVRRPSGSGELTKED